MSAEHSSAPQGPGFGPIDPAVVAWAEQADKALRFADFAYRQSDPLPVDPSVQDAFDDSAIPTAEDIVTTPDARAAEVVLAAGPREAVLDELRHLGAAVAREFLPTAVVSGHTIAGMARLIDSREDKLDELESQRREASRQRPTGAAAVRPAFRRGGSYGRRADNSGALPRDSHGQSDS